MPPNKVLLFLAKPTLFGEARGLSAGPCLRNNAASSLCVWGFLFGLCSVRKAHLCTHFLPALVLHPLGKQL